MRNKAAYAGAQRCAGGDVKHVIRTRRCAACPRASGTRAPRMLALPFCSKHNELCTESTDNTCLLRFFH